MSLKYKYVIQTYIIPVCFILLILISLPIVCGHDHEHVHHGHSHGDHNHHGHSHENEEPPSFKWSREANEAYDGDGGGTMQNDAMKQNHGSDKSYKSNRQSLWMEALGATLLISIAPYLILFIIPLNNTKEHEPYLKILLAFASGGLLGDAFLHLIPHALIAQAERNGDSHSHSHGGSDASHSHDATIGTSVLAGIILFLVVEKFVRIFKGGHSHVHVVPSSPNARANGNESKSDSKPSKKDSKHEKIKGEIKVAGYLNLAADFTHNLTDGLAIGASFLAGKSVGIVTTFTIFLHEIPHEIGDFAILLQSGCSKRKAMLLQLLTAVGALTGTVISLMAEGADASAVSWILPFTAGGFIYIATVSVMPELLENSHFWQSVCEVLALLLGVALMVAITWLEEIGGHVS